MKVPTRSGEECQHAMRALAPTEGRFLLNPDVFWGYIGDWVENKKITNVIIYIYM